MSPARFRIFRCPVAGIEAVAADTSHVFPRHSHEQYGIGVIHRGAQKSLSGRGVVEAGPGYTITVNPGEVHDGTPIGDDGRAWSILYFDPSVFGEVVAEINQRLVSCELARPAIEIPALPAIFHRLFAAMTRDDRTPDLYRDELLLRVVARVVQERDKADVSLAVPPAIRKVRELIDDEPTAPLTLADLGREAGLSRFQVLRGFFRATGFTPHAYLMQRRIDLVRHLIAAGTSLADAAAASGFADQSHMTRTFVRKYGVSPGAYAKAVG